MNELAHATITKLAHNIRKKRELLNYSQFYMASRLDVSQNAYSKIELGYTKISVERLFQIAALLDVKIPDLIEFNKLKPASNTAA
jgi:transcriptional regulator with XRE-family HTH domain